MTSRSPGLRIGRVMTLTVLLVSMVVISLAPDASAAPITISIPDTAALPGQRIYIPVIISTDADSVSAFQIDYTMDRPHVMSFPTEQTIDTLIVCADPPACTVADTTIDTVSSVVYLAPGDLSENWDYVRGTTLGGTNIRLTGLADFFGDRTRVIPPFTTQEPLLHMVVDVGCEPDPFVGNEVLLTGSMVSTLFSDPNGNALLDISLGSATLTRLTPAVCDFNYSGFADNADLQAMINCIFFNSCPICGTANLDLNCDNQANASDLNIVIQYLFFNAPDPACP